MIVFYQKSGGIIKVIMLPNNKKRGDVNVSNKKNKWFKCSAK